jgi:hypothetical protein
MKFVANVGRRAQVTLGSLEGESIGIEPADGLPGG